VSSQDSYPAAKLTKPNRLRTGRNVSDNEDMPQNDCPLIVLVIGASRGIGAATAAAFLTDGHVVFGTHRGTGVPNGVIPLQADITDDATIKAAIKAIVAEQGRLDVMVVSAGIAAQDLVIRLTADKLREVFNVNTFGAILAAKHAFAAMNRNRFGSIVLVSSESARTGIPGSSHYTASKAALEGFMRSAMWEFGPRGIRINVVAPGPTDTEMLAGVSPEERKKLIEATPLGRIGHPDEIADVIVWTATSTYLNGASIPVTGGEGLGY
jgi:beta-ketoacyl ACP reductase